VTFVKAASTLGGPCRFGTTHASIQTSFPETLIPAYLSRTMKPHSAELQQYIGTSSKNGKELHFQLVSFAELMCMLTHIRCSLFETLPCFKFEKKKTTQKTFIFQS
uniref:Uncharacterized protein n=1 Tax=Mola mola TaxID=94237 RepID=A0A3Q3X650_MOLML